jgi:hypothetical protein
LETSTCPNHTKLKGKTYFGAKEDGSIGGLEFYSPILRGDRGLSAVRKFCRLAKKQGFDVDGDCGFHLHIDMRTMSVRQRRSIAYAYLLTQKLWLDLVAEERWENTYCEPSNHSPEEIRNCSEDDFHSNFERYGERYSFMNQRAYCDHKTYELRGYQGTLNHVEICNWTKAHLRFVEAVCDKTLDELDVMFSRRKAKKTMRQILGNQLSRYYAKSWQKNAVCV